METIIKKKILIRVLPAILLLAVLYVLINNLKWHLFWTVLIGEEKGLLESLIFWDPIFITGMRLMSIWILAYHLYHYYQKEVVTAQLNPHFLFNSVLYLYRLIFFRYNLYG